MIPSSTGMAKLFSKRTLLVSQPWTMKQGSPKCKSQKITSVTRNHTQVHSQRARKRGMLFYPSLAPFFFLQFCSIVFEDTCREKGKKSRYTFTKYIIPVSIISYLKEHMGSEARTALMRVPHVSQPPHILMQHLFLISPPMRKPTVLWPFWC